MNYTEGIIKNTEFFTTAELADKLKMNVQVITRKVQAGEIQAYKIGKEWRIPEPSVLEWLESNANKLNRKPVRKTVEPTPTSRYKRKYLLEYILAQIEPHRQYDRQEMKRLISRHHADYESIQSELIDSGMVEQVDDRFQRRAGYRMSD